MEKEITDVKLDKYFDVTSRALKKAEVAFNDEFLALAKDFFDMASRYFEDAKFFRGRGDYVLAYGAINYAHGWLDAGARAGFFLVKDSVLFTVDDN
ncbi:MAG: DUF357 domain-containing protein [Candidatus Woesearchaeota archaeon]